MKYRIEYYRFNGEETDTKNIESASMRDANIYASRIIAESMDGTCTAIIKGEDGSQLTVNPFDEDDILMERYLESYGYRMNQLMSGAWQCLDEGNHELCSTVGDDDESNYSQALVVAFDTLAEKNGDSHLIS